MKENADKQLPAVLGRSDCGCSAELLFERLRFPQDSARLGPLTAGLETALQALLNDAACAEQAQAMAYVGRRAGQLILLVPYLQQTVGLPLRMGEKVLWAQTMPAIRLTPAAQTGVASESDALAMLAWLMRDAASGRALVLTDVATDSPLYLGVLKARQVGYVLSKNEPDAHLFHRFGGSYAEFFNQRSSKQRNQLRKKEKVFAERFGIAFEFKEYRQEQQVREFLTAAKAINRKTYQYRMFGESVEDDGPSIAASCRAAKAGNFRSFVLWHGDHPICFVLGHQRSDGTYEHRQTGFDPQYRDAAPGIYSNILLLQRLYEVDRPQVLDFGSGDSDYKRLFSNESRVTANPVLLPRSWRFMLAYGLFEASTVANTAAVQWLERLGVKNWIKRRLRGAA